MMVRSTWDCGLSPLCSSANRTEVLRKWT